MTLNNEQFKCLPDVDQWYSKATNLEVLRFDEYHPTENLYTRKFITILVR